MLVLLGGCSAQRGCSGNLTHQEPGLGHRDWGMAGTWRAQALPKGTAPAGLQPFTAATWECKPSVAEPLESLLSLIDGNQFEMFFNTMMNK